MKPKADLEIIVPGESLERRLREDTLAEQMHNFANVEPSRSVTFVRKDVTRRPPIPENAMHELCKVIFNRAAPGEIIYDDTLDATFVVTCAAVAKWCVTLLQDCGFEYYEAKGRRDARAIENYREEAWTPEAWQKNFEDKGDS